MKLRHIVVEGCDGTGKSTLIKDLLEFQGGRFLKHERASTSRGGPVMALEDWVQKDVDSIDDQPPSVYDRHPLISEPIYGPICRGSLTGKFNDPSWLLMSRTRLARFSLVIWCTPPWPTVRDNLCNNPHDQMPGVLINAHRIYHTYDLVSRAWPGVAIRYDYTKNDQDSLMGYLSLVFGKKAS